MERERESEEDDGDPAPLPNIRGNTTIEFQEKAKVHKKRFWHVFRRRKGGKDSKRGSTQSLHTLGRTPSVEDAEDIAHRGRAHSIGKCTDLNHNGRIVEPILKRGHKSNDSLRRPIVFKQTNFKEDVDVYEHDNETKQTHKNFEKLKEHPEETRMGLLGKHGMSLALALGFHAKKQLGRKKILQTLSSDEPLTIKSKSGLLEADLTLSEDHVLKRTMIIYVKTGALAKCDLRRLALRGSNEGRKIVVTAYCYEPLGDGTKFLREYKELFTLPHLVDPFAAKARLDIRGNLTVEAPLMTPDQIYHLSKARYNKFS